MCKEQVAEALGKMGLKETIRGETLSLAQFAEFSNILGSLRGGQGIGYSTES